MLNGTKGERLITIVKNEKSLEVCFHDAITKVLEGEHVGQQIEAILPDSFANSEVFKRMGLSHLSPDQVQVFREALGGLVVEAFVAGQANQMRKVFGKLTHRDLEVRPTTFFNPPLKVWVKEEKIYAVVYNVLPNNEGFVSIVEMNECEGLPQYFDPHTDISKGRLVVFENISFEEAEQQVAHIGNNPKFELLCRWAALHCGAG
jgi:hypothetical protein